jgi:hypothetical protein
MNYPGVVADVVALPLDQVLQEVPTHARVQYGLHFVLFLAFYKNWWRRGSCATADYRVGSSQSGLDNGEDLVQSGETWRELQTVCAMADPSVDGIWAQTTMGEFCGWPISGDICSVDPYQVAGL